jgi:hypothetical protein
VVDLTTERAFSISTQRTVIAEAQPDFGITVVNSGGALLTTRQLIALNVAGNRVGTRESPLIVRLEDRLVATGGGA